MWLSAVLSISVSIVAINLYMLNVFISITNWRYRHRYTGLYAVADLAKRLQKNVSEKKKTVISRNQTENMAMKQCLQVK